MAMKAPDWHGLIPHEGRGVPGAPAGEKDGQGLAHEVDSLAEAVDQQAQSVTARLNKQYR
jgi:hypothetical protein